MDCMIFTDSGANNENDQVIIPLDKANATERMAATGSS
jgi:hypothetical protein